MNEEKDREAGREMGGWGGGTEGRRGVEADVASVLKQQDSESSLKCTVN